MGAWQRQLIFDDAVKSVCSSIGLHDSVPLQIRGKGDAVIRRESSNIRNLFDRAGISPSASGQSVIPEICETGQPLALPEQHTISHSKNAFPKDWLREHRMAVAIIACALVVAWIHLCTSSIWYDEAITLLTTSGHAKIDWSLGLMQFKPTADLGKIVSDLHDQDVHPPLYFWTLAIWRIFLGPSLEVARSFSAMLIMCTLMMLYRLARDLGVRWPWIPVGVYAASAVGTWYAYDARSYAMATFLIVLTQFLAMRKSRWTGTCAAASFATHYFAALCVAPLLALEFAKRWRTERKWVALTLLSFAACCTPLWWLLRVHLVARPNQYPGFGSFPIEIWALLRGSVQGIMPNTWLPGWGIALLVAAFFVGSGLWVCIKKKNFELPVMYGAFLCGFLLLSMLTNKSIAEMPAAYYLGLAAPWMALLVGYGVNEFPRASAALVLLVIIGMIAGRPLVRSADYREMVSRMKAECSHCPIVVGTGYVGAVPACILYEARDMQVFLLKPDDTVSEVAERIGGRRTVFFVPTNEPPTAKIESEFLRDYLSARKNGYFEVSVGSPPTLERASNEWQRPVSLRARRLEP